MYPSRKEALEMRILDLKTRLDELDNYAKGEYEWMISGFEELRFHQRSLLQLIHRIFIQSEKYKRLSIRLRRNLNLSMMSDKGAYHDKPERGRCKEE